MMNFVRCKHKLSHQGLLYPPRSDASHLMANKPRSTDKDTSAKKLKLSPIPPNDRTTKDWTAIAWPTRIQSATPDGKFGPAKQMEGWGDCWFLAALAAVANDPDGHKLLAESVKKVDGGYEVAFKGLPNDNIFISDNKLQKLWKREGGDADTRLLELAADKFFSVHGNFRSLYIAALMNAGLNRERAEQCLRESCENSGIKDEMTFNPMRQTGHDAMACYMMTGRHPHLLIARSAARLNERDITAYLNQNITNDRDGTSVIINSAVNPLGKTLHAYNLVLRWDAIRTEITRDERLRKQERAFLNALNQWLETPDDDSLQALRSAAGELRIPHTDPEEFVGLLEDDQIALRQNHRTILQSGVQEVLGGGPGYIGLTGDHCEILEGINAAANTFTYSEPNYPTLVHTGELSDLIQSIKNGNVWLSAVEMPKDQEHRKGFEHAGTSRGRRLRQLHNQVAGDGKIDQAESRPLANLMEMNDGAFRHIYDSDKNGEIEGDELQAVKQRVDRMVDNLELTPIW